MTKAKKDETDAFPIHSYGISSTKVTCLRHLKEIREIVAKPESHKVRLALIALPELQGSKLKKRPRFNRKFPNVDLEYTCDRKLMHCNSELEHQHFEQYKSALSYVVKRRKANIVCINEFGFPSTRAGPCQEAIDFTTELAEDHHCFIVAGSFHDFRTFYNTGRFYFPGCEDNGHEYYHKHVSARDLEELVSIPPQRPIPIAEVFGLKIAVIICRDLLDYSVTAHLVNYYRELDLLLVPTYSERIDTLTAIARDVSEAMAGMVAIVNRTDTMTKLPCYLYCMGKGIKLREANYTNFGTEIFVYDIDIDSYENQKETGIARCDKYLQYFFGINNTTLRRRL